MFIGAVLQLLARHLQATESKFHTTFNGSLFHLPEEYKFKHYENLVECWVHNILVQDHHKKKNSC